MSQALNLNSTAPLAGVEVPAAEIVDVLILFLVPPATADPSSCSFHGLESDQAVEFPAVKS